MCLKKKETDANKANKHGAHEMYKKLEWRLSPSKRYLEPCSIISAKSLPHLLLDILLYLIRGN